MDSPDSLKIMITSNCQIFKNCYLQPIYKNNPNGPLYSPYELIITVYGFNSYEDTVIIVTQVLNQFGFNTTEARVEETINEMRSGACDIGEHNHDAAHYMDMIKKLDEIEHARNA